MGRVHIITDSSARFYQKTSLEEYDITVLPLHIGFGEKSFLADVDMDTAEMVRRITNGSPAPRVSAPSVEEFREAFLAVPSSFDEICVITHSAHITDTYANAVTAHNDFIGRRRITVVDSQTASGALGLIVEKAARDARRGLSLDEVVIRLRKNIPHLYLAFYTDQLDYLHQSGLIDRTAMIMGTMSEIKPLIALEEGRLQIMGKAMSFEAANEKLLEFALEFMSIDKICGLVGGAIPPEALLLLRAAIENEFSHTYFPLLMLDPLLISLLGPRSVGIAILERED